MHLVRTAEPAIEPLSLDDAKLHCRVDITTEDSLITTLITVARKWVEQWCINSLITQSYTVTYDYDDASIGCFFEKGFIRLPQTPILTIAAVRTYDSLNASTVFATSNYRLSSDRLVLNDGCYWASDVRIYDALQIDFTAGFGATADKVPVGIVQAMKLLVAQWYENRESITDDILAQASVNAMEIPFGVKALLAPYRTYVL